MFWIAVAILLFATIIGVLLAALVRRRTIKWPLQWAQSTTTSGAMTVGCVLMAVGFVLGVVVVVVRHRTGAAAANWRSPAMVLSRRQRRMLNRQLRGADPLDPKLFPLVRNVALRTVRQQSLFGVWIAFLIFFLGTAVLSGTDFGWLIAGLLAAVYLVAAVPLVRDIRQARAFLLRHPEPIEPAAPVLPPSGATARDDRGAVRKQAE